MKFTKTPFFSLFKMSGVPESMEMSLFGPLFDRSGKYLDYLVPKSRGFWPEGEKGGQKRGPKMGHFGGSPNPRKWWNFHVFGANFMFSRSSTPKCQNLGHFCSFLAKMGYFGTKMAYRLMQKYGCFQFGHFERTEKSCLSCTPGKHTNIQFFQKWPKMTKLDDFGPPKKWILGVK